MKSIASAVVALSLMVAGLASAEVPERLVYTGALSDQGQPFEGSVDMVFSIFDTASGGTALWSESHEGVAVTGGRLTVELGLSQTTLSEVFDGRKLYLDVNVDGQSMLPRVPVASVPYAFRAIDSDTVGGLTPAELGHGGTVAAADVSYDHAQSGLAGTDVQAAIDELSARVGTLQSSYDALQASHDALQTNFDNLQQAFTNISWNDLADIPAGFADGIDNEAVAGSVTWTDITNRPAGLDDGDDVGLTQVSWDDIQNTAHILFTGTDFIFDGLNVRVQSGAGATDGAVNGLGNLIVGYDEARVSGSDKSGSHNLVVGANHNYTSYAGAVFGRNNTVSGPNAGVLGGYSNTASGSSASVAGGRFNEAAGQSSAVSGGGNNIAGGQGSTVGGGQNLTSAIDYAWLAEAQWDDLVNVPAGFADGIDNEAVAGSITWTDIQNRPAGLDDGDDVGLQSRAHVTWTDISNRPAGLDDGDDVGLTRSPGLTSRTSRLVLRTGPTTRV